jgi:predicted dithiol-disulfide oxidoreductase (DUF899 family)
MKTPQVVSASDWTRARVALLAKEKEFTRARDALSQARRELPWERVERRYVFDGPGGEETLEQLFDGRSQLVVYHFMFGPDAKAGCKNCSFWADSIDRAVVHLAHRDVTLLAISRAPVAKLAAFKQRLGWTFKWVSSGRTTFNYDFNVSFDPGRTGPATYNYGPLTGSQADMPGISVFYRDEKNEVFHTYSAFGRGIDLMNTAYNYLDLVPKGRDEDGLPFAMTWTRIRDEYNATE